MKKNRKIILILILIILFQANIVLASDLTNGVEITDNNQFIDAGNKILGTVKIVGTICSVAALMLIGVKYMISSAEEKAEYKKTFWMYIIGAILVFGIVNLAEFVYSWTNSL